MQEAMTYYLRTAISRTKFGQVATPRTGNGENPFVSLYPCAPGGPNDYVFVMAVNPRMREAVCRTVGLPELLLDPRFSTAQARHENRHLLFDEIGAWTRSHTKRECMSELAEEGVCASQVYETNDLFTDPHLVERDFVHKVEHAVHGQVQLLGWPARMSKSRVAIQAAPLLGEHTDEVLTEDLGLSAEDISDLRLNGSIGGEMIQETRT